MINVEKFCNLLSKHEIKYFTGVPDSLLKSFCAYVFENVDSTNNVIAANEGAAVGLATGYHLGTGKVPLVYMQNSGLGNAINPLLSIADDDVYGVPMVLLIGWRGQPGVKDEPQHVKQGRISQELLDVMEIPNIVLSPDLAFDELESMVGDLIATAVVESRPVAILAEKGSFEKYDIQEKPQQSMSFDLTREAAIDIVLEHAPVNSLVVATTGMASREVFEIREAAGQGHQRDFLTVGGMGHASQIAMGLASSVRDRKIVCLDGDGAFIMHMGSAAVMGTQTSSNIVHIVLNNGAHDSVGGQPTVGFEIDICGVARACGYELASSVTSENDLRRSIQEVFEHSGPAILEIKVNKGNRDDLGRPTTTPKQNKEAFRDFIER